MPDPPCDLLVRDAELVATVDDARREIGGGWVAITDGLVSAVGGPGDAPPQATETISASGCLVTPGLINTHHHIYQNLTRSYRPAVNGTLFEWLTTLYPRWALLDEEASYVSAWVGLAELALGGCTTSTDHLYVHPKGGGDLITAEIRAAREVGLRFHPTRGSMSLSEKDGGLPPDSVVQDDDEILAESERLVAQHHDPNHGAMVRIALAPCSPFSVTPDLMRRTAELAERLDVRLHTHLAEDKDEDVYCLERLGCRPIDLFDDVGWATRSGPPTRTRKSASARGARVWPTAPAPTSSSAPAWRPSGSCGRPGRPSASAATAARPPTRRHSGWSRAPPCCSAASGAARRPCGPVTCWRWARAVGPPALVATVSWASWRGASPATSSGGPSGAWPSPAPCPPRSGRGCAAAPSRPATRSWTATPWWRTASCASGTSTRCCAATAP